MKIFRNSRQAAFTAAEVTVAIVLVVIVIFVCLPVFSGVSVKGVHTMALSNGKQVALALILYASDNNGQFPSYTLSGGKPTSVPVADSNTAFAQLFPTYIQTEQVFWLAHSYFCNVNPPDDRIDHRPLDIPDQTLQAGENHWAYVRGLSDSSNPKAPLVADGFADEKTHVYSKNPALKGGIWSGERAIVLRVDGSGALEKVDPKTLMVTGTNGKGMTGDIFTTAHAAEGWLMPENVVVNPK